MRGLHLSSRALHRVSHAHCRIHQPVEPPHRQHVVVGHNGRSHYLRAKAVQSQREEPTLISEQPPRDPPQTASQPDCKEDERQMQQILHAEQFVARLPHRSMERALGIQPVLRLAQLIRTKHREPLHGQRKPRDPVGKGAITIQVAAGCEVASQRRRPLPHFAATLRVTIVLLRELLVVHHPKAFGQKKKQQQRSQSLGSTDLDAGKLHAMICRP